MFKRTRRPTMYFIIIQFVNNLIIIFTISIVHGAHSESVTRTHTHTHQIKRANTQTTRMTWRTPANFRPCNRSTLPFSFYFVLHCVLFELQLLLHIQKFKYRTNGVSAYRLMSVDELTMCVCVCICVLFRLLKLCL